MKDKKALFTSKSDEWSTPQDFFDLCVDMFGKFSMDVAANAYNKKCTVYSSDGLNHSWAGWRVWCNPPYSQIAKWVEKCATEEDAETIALLIPARTDTRYFHEWIMPYAHQIYFVKGRLKFGDSKNSAPFPSMLVIFDHKKDPEYGNLNIFTMSRRIGEK